MQLKCNKSWNFPGHKSKSKVNEKSLDDWSRWEFFFLLINQRIFNSAFFIHPSHNSIFFLITLHSFHSFVRGITSKEILIIHEEKCNRRGKFELKLLTYLQEYLSSASSLQRISKIRKKKRKVKDENLRDCFINNFEFVAFDANGLDLGWVVNYDMFMRHLCIQNLFIFAASM